MAKGSCRRSLCARALGAGETRANATTCPPFSPSGLTLHHIEVFARSKFEKTTFFKGLSVYDYPSFVSFKRTCSLLRELILFEENLFSANVVKAAWALMGRNTCKSNTMWWYTCQACEQSFTILILLIYGPNSPLLLLRCCPILQSPYLCYASCV